MPTVREILSSLPADVTQHPIVGSPPAGVTYVHEEDPRFVPPDLTPVNGSAIELGSTALVLISAPAAVGKSMLARALARD
ncbi:MAG: hypothetical protein M3O90_08000, partial [Actinomycetota bacterium]|nr:hypothetical protein [Actinomycetota bacterium]